MANLPAPSLNGPSSSGDAQSAEPEAVRQVLQFISASKCKQAVELAKEYHKKTKSPESEALLVGAYYARVEQFQNKDASEDALTLLKLVQERFPAHRARFAALQVQALASHGDIASLIAPLAGADVPAEIRGAIESAIRRECIDLPALGNCPALPADHPLRTSAIAISKAFAAATTGPVTEDMIALPEVSRRSPLADWKMLVRALAAFYRDDDEACRRAMEAVAPDSAVRRLFPAIQAMIEKKPAPAGAGAALASRVLGDDKALREAMSRFEEDLEGVDLYPLTRDMRAVAAACNAARPELFERLRQHMSVACSVADVPVQEVRKALGASRKDAYFWRLRALANEINGQPLSAATDWNRFVHHAIQEKMFPPGGLEEAAVWLHVAVIVVRVPEQMRRQFRHPRRRGPVFEPMYQDQPPEIAAPMPTSDEEVLATALDPDWLFRRAAELDPDQLTFKTWLAWARGAGLPERSLQEIGETWQRKLPADPQAPLLLSSLAEGRKAFKLSLRFLADAEAIDAMNPEVRKARLRLTVATVWRHLKDKKPHLVQKDLVELEAMPAIRDGDRPAFLGALRSAQFALAPDLAAAQREYNTVADRVGPIMATLLMDSIQREGGLLGLPGWPAMPAVALPDPYAIAESKARTILLALDLRFIMVMPVSWDPIIDEVLRGRPVKLSHTHLAALGRCALDNDNRLQGYLASAAGLETATGRGAATFLLLRARSLPEWAENRRMQCLRAASKLARQANDPELIEGITREVESDPWMRRQVAGSPDLGDDLVMEVIKQEREARVFPQTMQDVNRYVVTMASTADNDDEESGGRAPSPFGYFMDEDDDDDDEDDNDGPYVEPPDLTPSFLPLLQKVIEKYGRVPPPKELARTDPKLAEELLQVMSTMGIDPAAFSNMVEMMARGMGLDDDSKPPKKKRRPPFF